MKCLKLVDLARLGLLYVCFRYMSVQISLPVYLLFIGRLMSFSGRYLLEL